MSIDRKWTHNVAGPHAGLSLSFEEGGHSDTGWWMKAEDIVPRGVSLTQKHRPCGVHTHQAQGESGHGDRRQSGG